ncbi:hypothetical protein [Pseudomonas sp. TE50-2]|uniref:hypothetical protein n=1 Tax=Pseudomonas sp. TE50-2 TaxID=3142707 RepID=UPI0034653DEA
MDNQNEDVYLIKLGVGKDKCPSGKLCLYTHEDYNAAGNDGDILVISPNIQLDEERLKEFGFPVGNRKGVTGIVNNMAQPGTLASRPYIDGETLSIAAGGSIPDLAYTEFPGGGTWNDKTRSVVSQPVEEVTLQIILEDNISLGIDQTVETELKIRNESNTTITGATITLESDEATIVSVEDFNQTINIPGKGTTTVKIPLKGHREGSTKLTARLYTPLGYINKGDNIKETNASVAGVLVTIRMSMAQRMTIKDNEESYAPLDITNESNIDIQGIVLEAVSANTTILTVGKHDDPLTLPASKSQRVNIPISGLSNGRTILTVTLTPPPGIINLGDTQKRSQVTVDSERDLTVSQKLLGHWKKVWNQPEYIYNYELTLKSENSRVVKWRLTFLLQTGAVLDPDWLKTQQDWLEVDEATEGFIALINKTGHTIEPGAELPLAIQVLYPGESDLYNELYNVHLKQEI